MLRDVLFLVVFLLCLLLLGNRTVLMCTACETAITRIMVLFCVTDCVSMGESRRPTNASDSEVTSAVFQVIFIFQLDLSCLPGE